MSVDQFVRYKADAEPWIAEFCCEATICSDLGERLASLGEGVVSDETVMELAATAVEVVSHFEQDPGHVDFFVIAKKADGEEVQIAARVTLDLSPEPVAMISLTPDSTWEEVGHGAS